MSGKKVALLATGNEIVNGDLLNTNGQAIAQSLFEHCIEVGSHLTVVDDQADIVNAMRFLLADHAALITIGGLGPTSDDKTRFALSEVIAEPLEFHQPSWDALSTRLSSMNYKIAESNRQQALFPASAQVIPNPNGTAAACKVLWQGKPIYMLPGPPNECLPIFNQVVLADLMAQSFVQPLVRKSWLLQGIGESSLADELDNSIDMQLCSIGYRASYPYLELKLESSSTEHLDRELAKVWQFIEPHIISETKQTASTQLQEFLAQQTRFIQIQDKATGGLLQAQLLTPATCSKLEFGQQQHLADNQVVEIELSGLDEYWRQQQAQTTQLELSINTSQRQFLETFTIRYGKRDIRAYAVEIACWQILQFLRTLEQN